MTDWTQPDAPTIAQIRDLVARARAADGVEQLSGHVLADLAGASVLPAYDAGVLVGVSVVSGTDPAELLVAPEHRGRGVGAALLADTLDRVPRVWVHGDLPAARELAAARALVPVRTLLQLRRPLVDLPSLPTLPAGVALRPFDPERDVAEFLAVNARAFDWHPEQGRLDEEGMRHEMAQPWFDPGGFFLAVTDDEDTGAVERILGFHWTKIHQVDPTPRRPGSVDDGASVGSVGEVYVIAVDPLSPVRRLGTPLTIAGLRHLADRGEHTVMLYVEGDNGTALELYRRLGFTQWTSDVVYARA